jgi:hypothetical protein
MSRQSLAGALSAAALVAAACMGLASPASATVTYTVAANFQVGVFAAPNNFFSITLPDFISSDQSFTAAQVNMVCGDAFVACDGVTFSTTDSPGHDVIEINFNNLFGTQPTSEFYSFAPTAFTTLGVYGQDSGFYSNTATLTVGVPEPASWALMILGVGAIGLALRQAKRKPGSAVAA